MKFIFNVGPARFKLAVEKWTETLTTSCPHRAETVRVIDGNRAEIATVSGDLMVLQIQREVS
jgi:hypothetical protein